LGLNIVRSIAEAHHGQVTFESTPGVGTTFWFTVPLRTSRPHPELVTPRDRTQDLPPSLQGHEAL
jgi:K+-sensing histidine kinase KdpD